jgi:hypothetical protein
MNLSIKVFAALSFIRLCVGCSQSSHTTPLQAMDEYSLVREDLSAFDAHIFALRNAFAALPADPNDKDWVKTKLDHMVEMDQYMRNYLNVLHEHSYTESQTQYFWTQFGPRWEEVDQKNTQNLKDLLEIYTWLKISEWGEMADRSAWLLVQHADKDIAFQKRVLAILEELYPIGETSRANYAYLYDRVASSEGRLQRYGTQGKCIRPGVWEANEMEDPSRIDERRAEMGLSTIAEYKARFVSLCK